MKNSKDNPRPFSELASILNLPKVKRLPKGITSKEPKWKVNQLRIEQKKLIAQRINILKPYKVGSYTTHDYRDGYGKTGLFLYNGIYYA